MPIITFFLIIFAIIVFSLLIAAFQIGRAVDGGLLVGFRILFRFIDAAFEDPAEARRMAYDAWRAIRNTGVIVGLVVGLWALIAFIISLQ